MKTEVEKSNTATCQKTPGAERDTERQEEFLPRVSGGRARLLAPRAERLCFCFKPSSVWSFVRAARKLIQVPYIPNVVSPLRPKHFLWGCRKTHSQSPAKHLKVPVKSAQCTAEKPPETLPPADG